MNNNKIRINGVHINLDEVSKAQNIKELGLFDNDAAYDALAKEIEAYKGVEKQTEPVKVLKGKKGQ